MVARDPLTRYWFIDRLARGGCLASIEDGWIIRPLQPGAPTPAPRPTPVPHVDPRDARAARRHMLGYWDRQG